MRRHGKITTWKDEQGFGFITPAGGGAQVFVHIKSFSRRHRRPAGNEIVTYEALLDDRGRMRAERVEFVGDGPTAPTQGISVLFAIPALFLVLVAVLVLTGRVPLVVPGFYLAASAVSFMVYAHDKSAAKNAQWRISENTLHMLSVIGGWPGAFAAQELLRHKSKKQSFQIVFWATVVLNCAGLMWLSSPSVAHALRWLNEFGDAYLLMACR